MDTSLFGFIAVAALVLANGFFVATEFAIVAVRASRLEQLAAEGHASARAAQAVVARLDTFIAACQLGITMASLALGWIGEPAFAHIVEPVLAPIIGSFAESASHGVAVGVSFALITALHIVIGELAPKGLALQRPEATALAVARPLMLFETVFRLPIRLLNAVGNSVLHMFGLQPASGHSMVHSVDEVRLLVNGMQQAGIVDDMEARIAGRAFRFGEVDVGELLTPRTDLAGVSVDASVETAIDRALDGGHNRLVVYDGSIDNIVGMLHLRDLVQAQRSGRKHVRSVLRSVLVTPAARPADELLEEMRAQRRHLAVVLDEYGSTAGIVTLQNLFEALVGRIETEDLAPRNFEVAEGLEAGRALAQGDGSAQTDASADADGSLVLAGLTRLDELEELTDMHIAPALRAEVDTVGGLVMAELGRMPTVGDEVSVAGRRLRVEAVEGRRIAAIRLLAASA